MQKKLHKYAKICAYICDCPMKLPQLHIYAKICKKYAKVCKICKHEIYMHTWICTSHWQLSLSLPVSLRLEGWPSSCQWLLAWWASEVVDQWHWKSCQSRWANEPLLATLARPATEVQTELANRQRSSCWLRWKLASGLHLQVACVGQPGPGEGTGTVALHPFSHRDGPSPGWCSSSSLPSQLVDLLSVQVLITSSTGTGLSHGISSHWWWFKLCPGPGRTRDLSIVIMTRTRPAESESDSDDRQHDISATPVPWQCQYQWVAGSRAHWRRDSNSMLRLDCSGSEY